MSNVSIYEKNWIDLVFEGRNKAYGAYKLRQENGKTSLIAFLSGITFFLAVIGGGLFLTSFGDAPVNQSPVIIDDNQITAVDLDQRTEPEEPVAPSAAQQPASTVEPTNLSNMVAAPTAQSVDVPINSQVENTPAPSEGNGTGTDFTPSPINGGGESTSTNVTTTSGNEIARTNELDKLPDYPGGMKKFYEYVARNFERPEIDEDGQITLSVIMSFVIEKDGTLTDIKAVRSTDYNMEKEATRILKASRVKWTPGIKDGKAVRTQFTLPIKVKI